MEDVKQLIDQYAEENRTLRVQVDQLMALLRDITVMFGDTKSEIRIVQKNRNKAEKYTLEIKQLKSSVVLLAKEKADS